MNERVMRAPVERGGRLLDKETPLWYRAVDTAKLDLAFGCSCVLGQAYSSYQKGLGALGLDTYTGYQHGFSLPSTHLVSVGLLWKELTSLWIEEIEVRHLAEKIERASPAFARAEELVVGRS